MSVAQSRSLRAPQVWLAVVAALAIAFALAPLATPAAAQQEEETQPPAGDPTEVDIHRYAGTQRYDTARLIGTDTFEQADTVVVARADLFPDTLAGNYLAGQLNAPILLVFPTGDVVADTHEALDSLGADNVVLVGGFSAISAEVEAELDAEYNTARVGGADRWETARLVATVENAEVGTWQDDRTAIVASGWDFPDALVAGGVSFSEDFPLLLTTRDELMEDAAAALDELDIERVIIPGGPNAVSEDVRAEIEEMGIEVVRVRGATRIETSIHFAEFLQTEFGWTKEHLNVATGEKFPDALTMGPHVGIEENPLVLTWSSLAAFEAQEQSAEAARTAGNEDRRGLETWIRDHACEILTIHIAGGPSAVSEEVEDRIEAAAEDCEFVEGLRLEPQEDVNAIGENHTVTAHVAEFANGQHRNPQQDVNVRFEVYRNTTPEDPDADAYVLVETSDEEDTTTDTEGHAVFTYTYEGTVGDAAVGPTDDIIVACEVTEEEQGDVQPNEPFCAEVPEGEGPTFTTVGAPEDDPFADDATKEWVERADAAVAGVPETAEPGDTVEATIEGEDADEVTAVTVTGECIVEGEQTIPAEDFGTDETTGQPTFTFDIAQEAEEGDCVITFTLQFAERPEQTQTETVQIVVDVAVDAQDEPVTAGEDATVTMTGEEATNVTAVTVTGDCVAGGEERVESTEFQTDQTTGEVTFTFTTDPDATAGDCPLEFKLEFDGRPTVIRTDTVIVAAPPQ